MRADQDTHIDNTVSKHRCICWVFVSFSATEPFWGATSCLNGAETWLVPWKTARAWQPKWLMWKMCIVSNLFTVLSLEGGKNKGILCLLRKPIKVCGCLGKKWIITLHSTDFSTVYSVFLSSFHNFYMARCLSSLPFPPLNMSASRSFFPFRFQKSSDICTFLSAPTCLHQQQLRTRNMRTLRIRSRDSCYNFCESQWCPVFVRFGSPRCSGRIEPLWGKTKTWEAHAVTSSGTLEEIMRTKEQSA